MPRTQCNLFCIRQEKYNSKRKRRYRNELDRWCDWCEVLFVDCNDIKCCCCDSKLKYKKGGSIDTYRARMIRVNDKNQINKKINGS